MLSQLKRITKEAITIVTTSESVALTRSLISARATEYLIRLTLKLFTIIRRRYVRSVMLLNIKRSIIITDQRSIRN